MCIYCVKQSTNSENLVLVKHNRVFFNLPGSNSLSSKWALDVTASAFGA